MILHTYCFLGHGCVAHQARTGFDEEKGKFVGIELEWNFHDFQTLTETWTPTAKPSKINCALRDVRSGRVPKVKSCWVGVIAISAPEPFVFEPHPSSRCAPLRFRQSQIGKEAESVIQPGSLDSITGRKRK
jgi:hypothetical protein